MRVSIFILAIALGLTAQDMPLLIKPEDVIQVAGLASGAFLLPTKCDASDYMYYRTLLNGNAPAAPVVRIAPDGSSYTVFQFDNLDGEKLKNIRILGYTPADSKLWLLGMNGEDKPLVLQYNTDGEFEKVIWLDTQIEPARFGVFQNGSFLIFGKKKRNPSDVKHPEYTAALALFDSSGKYLKDLSLGVPKLDLDNPKRSSTENAQAIDLAVTASGPEGVYVIPYAAPPALMVISPAGRVERTVTLWSPGADFRPTALRVNGSQAMVELSKPGNGVQNEEDRYVVYDLYSGQRIRQYTRSDMVTGSFACFDWKGDFTFLTARSGKRAVLKASVQ